MNKLTKKQFLKQATDMLMFQLFQSLLSDEDAEKVTMAEVRKQFPERSYFKSNATGEIKVGLSFKGVRKLLKNNPHTTLQDVRLYFGIA